MYAYERTNTPKLPWKPRILPIDFGRSRSRSNVGPAPFAEEVRTTCGTGRKGSIRSLTAIGPAPGPPPPCGWVKVLCRL